MNRTWRWHLRLRRTFLLGWVGVWLLIVVTPVWSIVIETVPGKVRVRGHVLSDDGKKLVLRIPSDAGKPKEQAFDRSKIKIIHQIDRGTLGKLTRDNSEAYRKYAEQLAKHPDDPEAVDTAMRLFLIAAYLDPAKQGRGCLLAMSELAPNPADARKYRAMAFLLDGKKDPSLLKLDARAQTSIPEAAWKSFQQALRKYRNGEVIDARELAKAKGVAGCFLALPGIMDQETFIEACTDAICPQCKYTNREKTRCATCNGKGKDSFTLQPCATCKGRGVVRCPACDGSGVNRTRLAEHVEAMVRAELAALNRQVPDAPAAGKRADAANWSSALSNPQMTPIPTLTLETITDYDPRKCVFRNGTWVAP